MFPFPSSSTITSKTPSSSPPSSPPKRAAKGVKNFVKGVKRRISFFGHHHRRSSGDQSAQSVASDPADSAQTQSEYHPHYFGAHHSPYLPSTIPLPPSPSSSRTRAHSNTSSQLSAPFSDSNTYASAEDSTLLSVNLAHKEQPEVEQVPLLSPIVEPTVMEVPPPSHPEVESPPPEEQPVTESEDEEAVESRDAGESTPPGELSEVEDTPSAPPVLEEPEVPDPFLVDDPEDPELSEEEEEQRDPSPSADEDEDDSTPADEIALAQSVVELPPPVTPATALSSTEAHPLASPLQVNKPMPPTPAPAAAVPSSAASSSSEEEDDPPALYISGLTIPTMFLPIPNTDALSTLLAKYIPPEQRPRRDTTGEWQRSDYHTLVMTNSWRALARMARDRIVATDPGEVALLLNLWYVRLSSLSRLRLYAQTNHEMANLFSVLAPPAPVAPSTTLSTLPSGSSLAPSTTTSSLSSYPSLSSLNLPQTQHRSTLTQVEYDYLRDNLLPFELEVLRAKAKYWDGDHMGYLDELRALLGRCKRMARRAGRGEARKGGSGSGRDEGALIEMKDYPAATTLLSSLLSPSSNESSPRLRAGLARVHLQSGNLAAAAEHFAVIAQDPTASPSLKVINAALLSAAEGDWEKTANMLREIVPVGDGDDAVGEKNEEGVEEKEKFIGIQVLENALKSSPSTIVSAEPMLFNLSTLYELRANIVSEKKRELLVEVAKWAGDGLRTTCLKMPAN
ncbi:hypothetical protein EIP91_003195 [Steccherinum ochraceum]|uniref:Uncharacterized protein n=1 Tax=Steccherinum ochraceum TaxID=92696 RepID=A0A4R0RWZ1_9APHY|nr:hypothetical protein EIP91_003195 [Steccherinum ochraceum]